MASISAPSASRWIEETFKENKNHIIHLINIHVENPENKGQLGSGDFLEFDIEFKFCRENAVGVKLAVEEFKNAGWEIETKNSDEKENILNVKIRPLF